MNIVSLLDNETVLPRLKADKKEEILNRLIDALQSKVGTEQLREIREAVFEREAVMSTGVGKGLAIPHGKASGIDRNYAALAILEEAVDYEAIDGEPVKLVFLLVGPESSNSMHIKMLSRISRLMNNSEFRERLLQADKADEILAVFREEEQAHFGN